MFISNLDNKDKKYYECGKIVGNYLIKSGIPVLSRKDGAMLFARTNKLQKVINNMPLYLRLLIKGGVING
jgi:hypothetical protein|nr:MAG TPA: hypothetical protein [Caudoviricetes sp.]